MEPVNKSVRNTIQFVLCLQDSCDKYRKCMEHLWQQEYTSYVNEWKQSQIEVKKQTEKGHNINSNKDSKCSHVHKDVNLEELEELALADSLLKKARHIRTKNQKLVNGLVDHKNISTSSADIDIVAKCLKSSRTLEKNTLTKQIPQSKSDFAIQNHKNAIVPRSKSATVFPVPKGDLKSLRKNKISASLSQKSGAMGSSKLPDTVSGELNTISSEDLDVFKKFHINSPTCHEFKEKKAASLSDSSGNRNQHQIPAYPSSKEFLNVMKGRLNCVSSQIKLKLWYPFLSSKSERFLTTVNCKTFSSIKKVYSILYSIQETMMWIDLLYLMEREIYPTLNVDANDVNMLRICSYLSSIFHPTSQRLPILDPSR